MSPKLLTYVALAIRAARADDPKHMPRDFIAAVACVLVASDCKPSDIARNLRGVADEVERGP